MSVATTTNRRTRRWRGHAAAPLVHQCVRLEVSALRAAGALDGRRSVGELTRRYVHGGRALATARWRVEEDEDGGLTLVFRHRGWRPRRGALVEQRIPLVATVLPSGGVRWFMRCPAATPDGTCGRLVVALLLPPSGREYACRACGGLAYGARRLSKKQRAELRARAEAAGTTVRDLWKRRRGARYLRWGP